MGTLENAGRKEEGGRKKERKDAKTQRCEEKLI